MPTAEPLPLRRAWSSKTAREAATNATVRLANSPLIRGYEKAEILAHLTKNPGYAVELHAALLELVEARAAQPDPHASLHEWGRRQRFDRAYHATGPDLSSPSRFNTRTEYTTR